MVSGEIIRILRNIKQLKQETVAKRLGISQPAYCKLEKSKQVCYEKLPDILKALGYSMEEFEKTIAHLTISKKV